ncbi:unnamed protein product [Closterium sp. Naga37s-1]|nr:unnamed protein product [Closterium sp. Naga37s-1]
MTGTRRREGDLRWMRGRCHVGRADWGESVTRAPPLLRHAVGTPPGGGGAQGAAVAGGGKAEGARRARIGGGAADGRKQAAGGAADHGHTAAAAAAAAAGGERGEAAKLGVVNGGEGGGGGGVGVGVGEAWRPRVGERVGAGEEGKAEEGKAEEHAGYERFPVRAGEGGIRAASAVSESLLRILLRFPVPLPPLSLCLSDSQYVQVREAYGLHLLAQAEATCESTQESPPPSPVPYSPPRRPLCPSDPQYVQVREAYGLHLLAQAEAKVARFFAADPFRHKSHGPLLDHSVCGVLSDPCVVHALQSDCLWDGFCAWCGSTDVCVDRASPMAAACSTHLHHRDLTPYQDRILRDAAKYVRVAAGGEMEHHSPAKQKPPPANAAAAAAAAAALAAAAATEVESSSNTSSNGSADTPCKIIIPGHFQFLTLDYDEMYWHWLLENFVPLLADMPYARLRDMRTHFILTRSTSTRHLPFLGLLSQSCWRSLEDMQEGTCLVEETKEEQLRFNMDHPSAMASAAARLIDRTAPHFVVDRLNLSHIPAPSKPQVLLVARRRRRLLLNEDSLVAATRAMGLPISIAVLEDLPLYEQIRAVRSCAILVGVHGSGLLNSMFLHPGSVLVQIVPYNTTGADRFYEPQVRQAGGSYMEVRVMNRSDSVFHWHLAEDHGSKVGTAEEREQFLQQGPDVQRASDVFFSFWVNQDVHVPVGEYRRVIGEAVAAWEQGRQQQKKRPRSEEQQRAGWAEEGEEGDAGVAGGEGRGVRDGRGDSREQG